MHLTEVFTTDKDPTVDFSVIGRKCSQFIEESNDFPLVKHLPITYTDIQKVKIRHKHNKSEISETINKAFEQNFRNLCQRAVFCNGESLLEEYADLEPFYVFPINGYHYVYCTEVQSSSSQYKETFDALLEKFGNNKNETINIMSDLLKYTYKNTNLSEGIESGAEIIIYNIPCYYAIRASLTENYFDLLTSIK